MINAADFKTKSEIKAVKMPKINGNNQYKAKTLVAIDGGYSSIKGISPNKMFIFPSYAKKTPESLEIISKLSVTDIFFRNNVTGESWVVGSLAEKLMDQSDIDSTTDASMYTRYRYDSEVYKVLMTTGLALGILDTPKNNEIFLQTGLPSTYKDRDSNKLINSLAGHYDISIKLGSNDWTDLNFDLNSQNISVMEQPMGTLCSVSYNEAGATELGKKIMSSNSIILDIGFGTEDIFSIKSGVKNDHKTYSDTGMKSVFETVAKEIENEYSSSFKIFELQKYLLEGSLPCFDIDTYTTQYVEFAPLLEKVNKSLCKKSIDRLMLDYNYLKEYKYLIVTGGTGESRFEEIKNILSGLTNLQILPGNYIYPDWSYTYSNVLGYYMYRHAVLLRDMNKTV